MNNTINLTNFSFPGQTSFYRGKVREVYTVNNDLLIMIASDRISAFDVVLPEAIPYKGQVLNQIASTFLDATSDIVPNWKIASPDPMVTIGHMCNPYQIEMIVRGYLTGSSWRAYEKGIRSICGIPLPDGMKEHQKFDTPLLTPTTKATTGHDEDISRQEIIKQDLVSLEDYEMLEKYSLELFKRGSELAAEKGLILVDTKYEFGKKDGIIYLIDEIHTPDSSRYFYSDGYEERFKNNQPQIQLSKEFVREWLIENGFQGNEGQQVPTMTEEYVTSVSERYIELFEQIMDQKFVREDNSQVLQRVETNINKFLKTYYR